MGIRQLIRESIFREINLIEEDKSRLIMKIPDNQVSPEQKQIIIDHFKRFPTKESDRRLDWNRLNKLTWSDFETVINEISDTQKKKLVKTKGVSGLILGEDYVSIKGVEFEPELNNPRELELEGIYIPLNWKASKLLASDYIGGVEGQWCISSNTESYWTQYAYGIGPDSHYSDSPSIFIFFIYSGEKYSLQVSDKYGLIVWNRFDRNLGDKNDIIPGINARAIVRENGILLDDVRVLLDKNKPVSIIRDRKATQMRDIIAIDVPSHIATIMKSTPVYKRDDVEYVIYHNERMSTFDINKHIVSFMTVTYNSVKDTFNIEYEFLNGYEGVMETDVFSSEEVSKHITEYHKLAMKLYPRI